jgi:hypothetical protein
VKHSASTIASIVFLAAVVFDRPQIGYKGRISFGNFFFLDFGRIFLMSQFVLRGVIPDAGFMDGCTSRQSNGAVASL